jgi:hypothetical protein
MKNKTNCIIIHGCPPSEAEFMTPEKQTYYKHWIPWATEQINKMGISTINPLMPAPWAPDYEAFKKEFEKYEISENTILIGHSCGCAFLVQWLGDTKQKIKKLILVAPWKIDTKNNDFKKNFYNFDIDKTIPERVKEIVMFTSDNEHSGGSESLEIYHQALGGRVITLSGRGHYIFRDMGTKEFPELLEEIN